VKSLSKIVGTIFILSLSFGHSFGGTKAIAGEGRLKTFTCSGELWNIQTDPASTSWLEIGHGISQCSIRNASSENAKQILSVCNLNAKADINFDASRRRRLWVRDLARQNFNYLRE